MDLFFILFAGLAIGSALGVILSRNPINSAMCLILNLLVVAAIYAQLEAHFLAAVQVIVYAGAIMVLVLFVLMLLNVKEEQSGKLSKFALATSVIAAVVFLVGLVPALFDAFPGVPTSSNRTIGTVKAMGLIIYTQYVFLFEAASLLIIAAMVGAIMLAKRTSNTRELALKRESASQITNSRQIVVKQC